MTRSIRRGPRGTALRWPPVAGCLILAFGLFALPSLATAQAGGAAAAAEEQARAHYHTGTIAFSAGRYADALAEFRKAYELSRRPKLLYNIGVAADRLRRDGEALQAFEGYLAVVPDAAERLEVEARIAVLRQTVARSTTERATPAARRSPPVAAPVTAPAPAIAPTAEVAAEASSSSDTSTGPTTGHWLALGGSVLLAVTGGVLLTVAVLDKNAVEQPDDGVRLPTIEDAHDRVPLLSTLGGVMLGVGLAGVAGTTLWIVLSGDEDQRTVQAAVGPGLVSVRGVF